MGALFISIAVESKTLTNAHKMMITFPIYIFILILALLSFYFKPFDDHDFAEKKVRNRVGHRYAVQVSTNHRINYRDCISIYVSDQKRHNRWTTRIIMDNQSSSL